MKLNLKTHGEVELTPSEAVEALLSYLKKEQKHLEAFNAYLSETQGLNVTRMASTVNNAGETVIRLEVQESKNQMEPIFVKKKTKDSNEGFVMPNKGFTETLTELIDDYRRKRKTELPLDVAKKFIFDRFPNMSDRRFGIYIRDKRVQKKYQWVLDTKKKVIRILQ